MFIAKVDELRDRKIPGEFVCAYVLYRRAPHEGARPIRLGRRRDPSALLQLVKHYVPKPAPVGATATT